MNNDEKLGDKDWKKFEKISIQYHKNNYKCDNVWLWHNVPEEVLINAGYITNTEKYRKKILKLPLPVINTNYVRDYGVDGMAKNGNIYTAIQAKHYTDKRICAKDVGSFQSVVFNRLKIKNPKNNGVLYHTSKLQSDLKKDLLNGGVISTHKLPLIKEETNNEIQEVYELYDYQKEALKVMLQWDGKSGLLSMPCGTGKTNTLKAYLEEIQSNNVIILSTTKVLTLQNYERLKLDGYTCQLVDSDRDGTRDIEEIQAIINTNNKVFLSSTYKSIDIIKQLKFNENSTLCIDECHNIDDNIKEYILEFPGKIIKMSATPAELLDDDVIYQITEREAIQMGYICDYDVYIPLINDKKSDLEYELKDLNYDTNILDKAEFLVTAMKRLGKRRCIVYLSSISQCKEFAQAIDSILKYYHNEKVWSTMLTDEDKQKQREEKLNEFQNTNSPETYRIITSVRILNEGIDVPLCDSIFIANPPKNMKDATERCIIQRKNRATRKVKDDPDKRAALLIYCNQYDEIASFLQYLKFNDPDFSNKLKTITSNYDTMMNSELIEQEKTQSVEFKDYVIGLRSLEDAWTTKYNIMLEYIKKYGKLPGQKISYNGHNIGYWIHEQLRFEKNDKILPERKVLLENIPGWKWRCKEEKVNFTYEYKFNSFRKYFIENNNNLPKNKEIYDGFNIHSFCYNIRTQYNKGKLDANIQKDFSSIPGWFWSEYDLKYDLFVRFINIYGRPPKETEIFEKLPIGQYYSKIKQSYKKEKLKEIDTNRFSALPGWKWAKKQLTWDESYNILLSYVEKYNKLPVQLAKYEDKNIGQWCNIQRQNKQKLLNIQKEKLEAVKSWYW